MTYGFFRIFALLFFLKDMNDWLIIVNPNAGSKKGEKDWSVINELLDKSEIRGKVCFTEAKDHATEIVLENIPLGYRKIISVGGDGTMNEIVNGIFHQNKIPSHEFKIGVIPVGTGNDWCKMFHIPTDYVKAIEIIKKDINTLQDVGWVDYKDDNSSVKRYFVNVAGMGFDAEVLKKANEEKEEGKIGKLSYFKNILSNLMKYKSLYSEINIDNNFVSAKMFSLNVGICKYSGNGMMQVPGAIHDDGLFDVTLIRNMSKIEVIRNIKNLYDGSFVKHKKVDVYRGRNIYVNGSKNIRLEVDGEYLGTSPFTFNITHKALKIIVKQQDL